MKTYTAVVVGGGPSGHSAAVRIAQLGGRVALVERDYIGGICTNWGCTPSKAMIESAKVARTVHESEKYGIKNGGMAVDFEAVAARRDQVVLNTRSAITSLLEHHKIDLFQGEGIIESAHEVRVRPGKLNADGEHMLYDGTETLLSTENVIISTGSKPLIPPFINPNDPSIVSSNRLISIRNLPESLTIVGGGVIGIEFATIFSNLGSKVTIVEFLDRVLALMDEDISTEITRILAGNGVRILTSHKVTTVENGLLKAEDLRSGKQVEVVSPMTLIAIGRQAVVNADAYERLGLTYSRKGVDVDEFQRTNVPGIWAVGDATGRSILAHVGIQQGIIAAENIMAQNGVPMRAMDYTVIPAVIYSQPEIVGVGSVPADLSGVDVVKVPFSINLRAGIEDYQDGFIKLWIRERKLLAAQAIGQNVSEIMQEAANMIALKTDIADVAEIIHAHPTYAEIIRSALDHAMNKAVDFYI